METDKNARTWATICHLSALLMLLLGIPIGNILSPLVIWLIKRREYEFVDEQGKEALNFQITFTLCAIALFILIFLLIFGAPYRYQPYAIFPAMLLMMGLVILNIGLVIMAAIKSNDGISYRYPFALRIIK
jgi:uncharacterized Tic20 family protein